MFGRPLPAHVASRRIGDATVTIISEGALSWAPRFQVPEAEWRRAMPEADTTGKITLGLNLAHISIGNASILVDPGFDDPSSAWQRRFAAKWPGLSRSVGLLAGLASIGVQPEEITHVVITHTHEDHFAGVTVEWGDRHIARFPRARHLLGRGDWEGNPRRAQSDSELAIRLGTIERLGLLDVIDGEHAVVPDVTIIHAPGETPGHSIVRIRSASESFYYLGDLFHHHCEVEHLDWVPAQVHDHAAMRASRDRLIAEAVPTHATVVFTHERFPGGGTSYPSPTDIAGSALGRTPRPTHAPGN